MPAQLSYADECSAKLKVFEGRGHDLRLKDFGSEGSDARGRWGSRAARAGGRALGNIDIEIDAQHRHEAAWTAPIDTRGALLSKTRRRSVGDDLEQKQLRRWPRGRQLQATNKRRISTVAGRFVPAKARSAHSRSPPIASSVLATAEVEPRDLDPNIRADLFGYSKKNRALVHRPTKVSCSCLLSSSCPADRIPLGHSLRVLHQYHHQSPEVPNGLPGSCEPEEARAGGATGSTSASPKEPYQGGDQSTAEGRPPCS